MEIKSLKCPECGANILMQEGEEVTFCSHCGTQLYISPYKEHKKFDFSFNEKSKIQKLKSHETQLETENRNRIERQKRRDIEDQKFNKTMWIFRFIRWICFIAFLVCFYIERTNLGHIDSKSMTMFLAYCFVLFASIVNLVIHFLHR